MIAVLSTFFYSGNCLKNRKESNWKRLRYINNILKAKNEIIWGRYEKNPVDSNLDPAIRRKLE